MSKKDKSTEVRRLIDLLAGSPDYGALRAVLATSYDLNPGFFDTDFLPSLFGIKAWDDQKWSSRIGLERELAKTESISVLMDGRRYQGPPRSLRVEVSPHVGDGGQCLHAKLTLLVYERAVRLLVASANLTEPGYRLNHEVAVSLTATAKKPAEGSLIVQALRRAPALLKSWWTPSADHTVKIALDQLSNWGVEDQSKDEQFVWGGASTPLWQEVLNFWPKGEKVERITIVSPFWSEEHKEGPFSILLDHLAGLGGIGKGAELTLVTSAIPDTGRSYRPALPATTVQFDSKRWGISAYAVAADPRVKQEEVSGGQEILVERSLHAKVLLVEGSKSSLAYVGSANFSRHGWGFLGGAVGNVEAGLVLTRTGKHRASLSSIIPTTTGDRIPLAGTSSKSIALMSTDENVASWPTFLRGAYLEPDPKNRSTLLLSLELASSRIEGPYTILVPDTDPVDVLFVSGTGPNDSIKISLKVETIEALFSHRRIRVSWWDCEEGAEFPVNVSRALREDLPIGSSMLRPTESMLLAYYQGRISWEDLFIEPEAEREAGAGCAAGFEESSVDISNIQSYQVRAFVEALQGIECDLRLAAVSKTAIRMSVLGPVSPVALASEVTAAAKKGLKSATAAGFQLVELLGCLGRAQDVEVEDRLRQDWTEALAQAAREVRAFLAELRELDPAALKHKAFAHYEKTLEDLLLDRS